MRLAASLLVAGLALSCAFWDGGPYQLVLGSVDQGCTLSPDVARSCCLAHDSAYWIGGTEQDRFTADAELLACFALYGVPERIATVYYRTVRQLGGPHWNHTETRSRGPGRAD